MIKRVLNKLDIKNKTIILMGLFVVLVVSVFLMVFSRTYQNYEENLFGQESLKTLHTLDMSLYSFIQSADNYSKMLISDSVVQEQMNIGELTTNIIGQQKVLQKVYSILQFSEVADEIWFIDKSGKTLKIGEYSSAQESKNIEDYSELRTPYGRARLLVVTNKDNETISLVRSYNNLNDFSSIGIIGVEFNKNRFKDTILNTVDIANEKLLIIDNDNSVIFWSDDNEIPDQYIKLALNESYNQEESYNVVKFGRDSMLMSKIKCANMDWKIVRYTPLPVILNKDGILWLNMSIIVVIGLLMLVGSSFMAKVLAKPSEVMLNAMSTANNGVPQKIEEKTNLKEFGLLYDGYNSMVERISLLIDETIERQKRIRQVELNEIQEQMKPHFLYNTLESVEALAMMGDTKTVCRLIEAIGDFYRKSVSGGREFLTIEEEIRIAKDYIEIMEIRFGESFHTEILCDKECLEYMIPKLTIQPLVENAFQYGVRAKSNHGNIYVKVSLENDNIHIMVGDSGDGVPDEIIIEIRGDNGPVKGKSLGLRGTIERLRLMYGESFKYEISKKPSRIDLYINIGNLTGNEDI